MANAKAKGSEIGTGGVLFAAAGVVALFGVSMLLFGVIAASGIRILVEGKVDYNNPVNLLLTAIVMGLGVSTASITIGTVTLKGMALATIVAIILSTSFHIINSMRGNSTEKRDNEA